MNNSIVPQTTQHYIFSARWACFDIPVEATPAESIHTIRQQIQLANILADGQGPVCPHCGEPTYRRNVRAIVERGELVALHRDCNEVPDAEIVEVRCSSTGFTARGRGRYDWPESAAAADGLRRVNRMRAEAGI